MQHPTTSVVTTYVLLPEGQQGATVKYYFESYENVGKLFKIPVSPNSRTSLAK